MGARKDLDRVDPGGGSDMPYDGRDRRSVPQFVLETSLFAPDDPPRTLEQPGAPGHSPHVGVGRIGARVEHEDGDPPAGRLLIASGPPGNDPFLRHPGPPSASPPPPRKPGGRPGRPPRSPPARRASRSGRYARSPGPRSGRRPGPRGDGG